MFSSGHSYNMGSTGRTRSFVQRAGTKMPEQQWRGVTTGFCSHTSRSSCFIQESKGHTANIVSLEGQIVFVTVTQLCCCGLKSVITSVLKNGYDCVLIKLRLQRTGRGPDLAPGLGHSVLQSDGDMSTCISRTACPQPIKCLSTHNS